MTTESSDEATAFDVVAYNARTAAEIATRTIAQRHSPAGLSGFSYDTAIGALEDCAGEAYNEGFTAGRAAALDVMDNERKDFMKAISIHIDAANQWRLRFKRLAQAFGLEWQKGQDVEDFIADAISRAGGTK